MKKIKSFFKKFCFFVPFHVEPELHHWLILFNGDFVGVYFGEDYEHFFIEHWMVSSPGDPEPITLVEFFQFY